MFTWVILAPRHRRPTNWTINRSCKLAVIGKHVLNACCQCEKTSCLTELIIAEMRPFVGVKQYYVMWCHLVEKQRGNSTPNVQISRTPLALFTFTRLSRWKCFQIMFLKRLCWVACRVTRPISPWFFYFWDMWRWLFIVWKFMMSIISKVSLMHVRPPL